MSEEEWVDILQPPTFEKTGESKPMSQAWDDEDWIGTFNLWIVQNDPEPAIVYQQRSMNSKWEPGKLDVTVGGHYNAGESEEQGLREAKEEVGRDYKVEELFKLGRKIHVGPDTNGRMRHNLIDIFIVIDNALLADYTLEEAEVSALFICPLSNLLRAFEDDNFSFESKGISVDGSDLTLKVSSKSFPFNWDNYHYKAALLIDRYLKGDKKVMY